MSVIAIMVVHVSEVGKNLDVACCSVINEEELEQELPEFERLAEKLGAKVLWCEGLPQVMCYQYLEEEIAEQKAEEEADEARVKEVYCTGCLNRWEDCSCTVTRQPIKRAYRPVRR